MNINIQAYSLNIVCRIIINLINVLFPRNTALHIAVFSDRSDMVEILLKNKASVSDDLNIVDIIMEYK